ncbi:MAG: MFS transporter, partial [Endomicrobium sp.]|nr:MFS transporter [Endomicrobium sp.]
MFLVLIPFMSWALPFMIIPLAVMIPCAVVAFFELYQKIVISNAQLKISEMLPSQMPQGKERLFILNKLLAALPQELKSQVQDLVELKDDMDPGVVMHYDQRQTKININVSLIRVLFFDESGKNVKNQKLLITFLKHELAHKEFANPQNRVRSFIHRNFSWLEEFLVSFGDIVRYFSQLSFIRQLLNYNNTVPIKWTLPKGIKIPNLPGRVDNGMFIEEPVILEGKVVLPDGRRGVINRVVKINGAENEEFEFGKTPIDSSVIKSIEIEYVFTPDNYIVRYVTNGGTLNTDDSSWAVKSGTSHNVPAIPADKLPSRQGYELLGCEYLISTGEIRKISLEEMQRGFTIPISDISGDVNIILRWKPKTHEVAYRDGDNIIRLEQTVEAGQALRVRGLGIGAGVGRLLDALAGCRAGVRPHKITFDIQEGIPSPANMPRTIDADEGIVLNAPEIPEGIIQLENGKRGIVKRIVQKASGEEVSFTYGETRISEDLTIRYVFEPYDYSLVYKENGRTYAQPLDGIVIVNGQANQIAGVNPSNFPQKDGYMFAGYKYMNSQGQVITISRFDVEKGFEIPLEDSYGAVTLIAQWVKVEQKDNYTVTFETQSEDLTSQILSDNELLVAESGKPLSISGEVVNLAAEDLRTNNWDVRGYEVLINGVGVLRVNANEDGYFSDATLPAEFIQGEITIKFIRYPKIRFINLENNKEYSVSLEQGFTEKDLKKLLKKELGINNKKDLWWKRSDNQSLTQIVTAPITIEVANSEFKGSHSITILDQAIDYIKTMPIASIVWSIVWTAFSNLTLSEKILVVGGLASIVTLLLLMILGSMPWVFVVSGLISIIFIVIKLVTTLFTNIKNELLNQVTKELDGELYAELISAIKEAIDSVLNILQTELVEAYVENTTMDTINYIFYGIFAYTITFAILISFGVIGSSFLLAIPFIAILGFAVYKIIDAINTSGGKEEIISFAEKILGIFQDLFNNLNIELKFAVIGCFVGALGGVILIFTVSTFALLGLVVFGSIFVLSAIAFFILFYQDKTIEIIKQRLQGTEVGRVLEEVVGVVGVVSAANQGTFVNDFSVGQILKLIREISKISWAVLDNFPIFPIIRKIIKSVLGIALRHSKQYALKAIGNVFESFKERAGNFADKIKKGCVASEIRGYANNVYEAMTNIADSIGDVPTKEGYEFDGFIVKKQNSDEQLRVTREEADSDFVIPPEFTVEDVYIVIVWKPKIIIATGDGRRKVLAHTTKDPLEILPEDNNIVSLRELSDKLKPPKGFDYASLYWTCDAPEFVDREFKSDETLEVHEHCTFTPHWKPLPEVKIAVGTEQKMGQWKKASGNAAVQQKVSKVKATPEGALVDLRPFIDSLVAPEDCDPESLYWTIGDTDERAEVQNGRVIAKGNTVYTPHWLTYAQAGKVKIKTKKDKYKVVRNREGRVDLKKLGEQLKLKTPDGYIEGSLYWTADGREDHLTGEIDIRDISILTPHWVANSPGYSVSFVVGSDGQIEKMRCVRGEQFPSKDVSKYAAEIFDGVKKKRDAFYTRVFD